MGVSTWRWRSAARGFCLNLNGTGVACIPQDAVCCTCVIVQKAHSLAQESRDRNRRFGMPGESRAERAAGPGAEKVPRQLGGTDVNQPGKWLATVGARCRRLAAGRL